MKVIQEEKYNISYASIIRGTLDGGTRCHLNRAFQLMFGSYLSQLYSSPQCITFNPSTYEWESRDLNGYQEYKESLRKKKDGATKKEEEKEG